MKTIYSLLSILLLTMFGLSARAQVGIYIGNPEPQCQYGYYDYAPYSCAPYGFYGPEYFVGGRYHPRQEWGHGDRDRDHGHQKPDAGRSQQRNGHAGSGRQGQGGHGQKDGGKR